MFKTLKMKARELLRQPPSTIIQDYLTRGMIPPPEALGVMQEWYRSGPQIGALLLVPGSRLAALKLLALAVKEDPKNAKAVLLASMTPRSWWLAGTELVEEVHKTTLPFPRMPPVPPVETFRIVFETRTIVPRPSGDAPTTHTVTKVFVGERQVRDVESVSVSKQTGNDLPCVVVNLDGRPNDEALPEHRRKELRDTCELLLRVPFVRISTPQEKPAV